MKNYNEFLESVKWYVNGEFIEDDSINLPEENKHEDFITNDKFRQFLIDHDCYDKYINNVYNYKCSLIKNCETIDDYIKWFDSLYEEQYIDKPFSWFKTPERADYWSRINDIWVDES